MSAVKTKNLLEQIAIVEMHAADLDEVVAIERESNLSPWGRAGYLEELWNQEAILLIARQSRTRIAPENRSTIGFATARLVTSAAELHINNIAVSGAFRQVGLGTQLLRALLARGRAAGATTALLEVRASNIAAQALYGRFGFSVIGERKAYYSDPVETALVMQGIIPARA
jgi:ribosomal-protein-alanine N-acetyltransferase